MEVGEFFATLLTPVLITGGMFLAYVFAKILNSLNKFKQKKNTVKEILNIKYKFSSEVFWESILDTALLGFIVMGLSLLASVLMIVGLQADGIEASAPAILLLGMTVSLWTDTLTNLKSDANLSNEEYDIVKKAYDDSLIENNVKELLTEFFIGSTDPEADYQVKKAESEQDEKGGLGAIYSIGIANYDTFRAAVINKGFDIDGYYGWQCWDGAALLWQQIGKSLSTGGTGTAKGCWTNARAINAGTDFDLITSVKDVKRGDVVVFGGGQYGHIGFADANYTGGNWISTLGQNQGGNPGLNGGAAFNIANVSANNFLGAFRFKRWTVAPAPTPKPNPTKSVDEVAQEVINGKWGNNPERQKALEVAGYDYNAVQKKVNQLVNKAPQPTPEKTYTVRKGDNLWNIAVYCYNNGSRWTEIYNKNKDIIGPNPNIIQPGMVLKI